MFKKIIVLMLVFIIVLSTTLSFAITTPYTLNIGIDNNRTYRNTTIRLNGEVLMNDDPKVGTDVTIKIEGNNGESVQFVEQVVTDMDGKFQVDIYVNSDFFNLGEYVIYVNAVGLIETVGFEVISRPTAPTPTPPTPTPTPDPAGPEETDQGTVEVTGEEGEEVATVVIDDEKIIAEIDDESVEIFIDAVVEDVEKVVVEVSTTLLEMAEEKGLPIVIDAGYAKLEIPAGLPCVSEEGTVSFTIEKLSDEGTAEALAEMNMLDTYEAVSELIYFDLSLNGESIECECEFIITIPITLDENGDPRKVGVYYLNEATGNLEYIGGIINEEESTITFTITHFSMFMAIQFNKTFEDISIPWAQDYIEVLASRHIIKGIDEDTFLPNNNITRAEFATLLVRALDLEATNASVAFGDLAKGSWYEESVLVAASHGIVKGFNNEFDPNGQITREAMATMIVRAMKLVDLENEYLPGEVQFKDEISDWASEYVSIAYKHGIVKGLSEEQFGSGQSATRAQAAVMIYRLLETLGEL